MCLVYPHRLLVMLTASKGFLSQEQSVHADALVTLINKAQSAISSGPLHSSCSRMGKKKSFIDKKNSKTYTLVFRTTEDNDEQQDGEGDRVLVPADSQQGAAAAAAAGRDEPPTKDPRALYAHFFGGDFDDEKVS